MARPLTITGDMRALGDPKQQIVRAETEHWTSVAGFGAKGDGVTNDAAAIQRAIDYVERRGGGTVVIPAGIYVLGTSGLSIASDNVCVMGVGQWHTYLKYSGSGAAIAIGTPTASKNYVTVDNLRINHTSQAPAWTAGSIGIRIYGGQSHRISNVWINSFETGILLDADGGDMGWLVGDNLDHIRISAPKIGLKIESPTTALFARALHLVGPGKTEAGSIGIEEVTACGQGNHFIGVSIETFETGFKLGGNQQVGFGIRIEGCTTGIAWASAAADNCSFFGVTMFSTTTNVAAPPTGTTQTHLEINGSLYSVTDDTNYQTDICWVDGVVTQLALGYDPTGTGHARFRNGSALNVLSIYRDGPVEVGMDSSLRGLLTLWDGPGGNTPGAAKIHSPNGTAWYLFVEDDGTVKIHNAVPTQNSDGSEVGLQT